MTQDRQNELVNRYVSDYNLTLEQAQERLRREIKLGLAKEYYDCMVEQLSLKQYVKLIESDHSMYSRAVKTKAITKCKNTLFLANCIIYLLNNDKSGLDALQIDNVNARLRA